MDVTSAAKVGIFRTSARPFSPVVIRLRSKRWRSATHERTRFKRGPSKMSSSSSFRDGIVLLQPLLGTAAAPPRLTPLSRGQFLTWRWRREQKSRDTSKKEHDYTTLLILCIIVAYGRPLFVDATVVCTKYNSYLPRIRRCSAMRDECNIHEQTLVTTPDHPCHNLDALVKYVAYDRERATCGVMTVFVGCDISLMTPGCTCTIRPINTINVCGPGYGMVFPIAATHKRCFAHFCHTLVAGCNESRRRPRLPDTTLLARLYEYSCKLSAST